MALNLDIYLQPKQIELYSKCVNSDALVIGYGGSKGGAKSHGVRDVFTVLGFDYPGIQMAIFRRISKQLTSNHIIPYFQKYPQLRQYYNVQDRMLKLPKGSNLSFLSSDQEDEIYNIQGSEFDLIAVDEATFFTKKQLDFLRTCIRGKIGFKTKSIWTTNPGQISHTYIKRLFIDRNFDENEYPEDYEFLSARIYDNVIWVQEALHRQGYTVEDYYYKWNDEQRKEFCNEKNSLYYRNLKGLPPDLQEAYIEGNWDIFGGQFFKNFSKSKSMIPPFEIPQEWELIGSIDPGWSSPCSFGLTARDFNNNYYRIATYYEEEQSPEQHATAINKFIEDCPYTKGRKPGLIVSGTDAWAKKDRYAIMANELTFSDVFQSKGLYLTRAVTDRKQGWGAWKSLLPDRYFVFDGLNIPLTDEISAVISDAKQPEDIQGKGKDPNVSDHALDEQRYGIMALFEPPKQPEKEEPSLSHLLTKPKERNFGKF